ncbi:MAG: YceD family protein [Hydrogenophilaceae bacterium]
MRFARAGEDQSGEVRLSDLTRLADVLVSDDGAVSYRIRGGTSAGRPILKLDVDTAVMLICQSCLEPYRQEMRISRVFPVARDEKQLDLWERDDPLLDALVADPELDVLTLVEDEILLSLPVVPRHAEGECGLAGF